MVQNWNSKVSQNDQVFFLGDFAFYKSFEKLSELVNSLNGTKVMIMGNHDKNINPHQSFWRKVGFNHVYKYPIIIQGFYILSHEPVFINEHMPYINVHGHIHEKNYDFKQYVNVCVEQIDYTPIKLNSIIKSVETKIQEI